MTPGDGGDDPDGARRGVHFIREADGCQDPVPASAADEELSARLHGPVRVAKEAEAGGRRKGQGREGRGAPVHGGVIGGNGSVFGKWQAVKDDDGDGGVGEGTTIDTELSPPPGGAAERTSLLEKRSLKHCSCVSYPCHVAR